MNQASFFNQLLFVIFGVLLAGLFASTLRVGGDDNERSSRRYWLLSVGARSGAFLSWSLTPYWGPLFAMLANGLFIFSAGCLALLFRSWRVDLSRHNLIVVTGFALLVSVGMETLRQSSPHFEYRMILLGSASLLISLWELSELRQKIKTESDRSLRLIALIVFLQMLMSAASIGTSIFYADRNIAYVTDNGTKSIIYIWGTLTVHLVIYLFIGGYLYQRAIVRAVKAVKEKNDFRRLLEEREHLLSSLISSNRVAATGALSASIAHEISQPLTAASMQVGILRRTRDDVVEGDQQRTEMLDSLQDNISHAKEILDTLRKMFRGRPANMAYCSIDALVSRTLPLVKGRLQSAQVTLDIGQTSNAQAEVAEIEIQQVLINLINNAVDSLAGGEPGHRHIVIDLADNGDTVAISVADNGLGIDAVSADSLFELSRSNKDSGMGIGLWIARHIVEDRHRGRLYIDFNHRPGARFVMELPKQSTN